MLVSLLRRVRGGGHLPQDAQPTRGGAGFAFGELSRSRKPSLSSLTSLPKLNVPFLLWNCSEWSFPPLLRRKRSMSKKGKKKKITAMKRKVIERDRLGMKLVAGGGGSGERWLLLSYSGRAWGASREVSSPVRTRSDILAARTACSLLQLLSELHSWGQNSSSWARSSRFPEAPGSLRGLLPAGGR